MVKIKSQFLLAFLIKHEALDNPEKRKKYKKLYRREYQRQWAKRKRKSLHELRFYLEDKPYKTLEKLCKHNNISPSLLAKSLLLEKVHAKASIPNRSALTNLSADLGLLINKLMKTNQSSQNEVLSTLLFIEERLLNYLNDTDHAST
ncbi:MAG: hypothetical protein N4A45_05485 [Flavobacteriales bacterium]|jgi:hypothetical protein|nr:hypothetical protein [Flavobacteriales bacterium]